MSRSDLLRRVLSAFFKNYAGKLTGDDKYDLTDSRTDSGFISSGNLMLSQEISGEIILEDDRSTWSETPSHRQPQIDSGIIDDHDKQTGQSMHIDSGVCLTSDLSLSEKISKLNLEINDLDQPKTVQVQPPPVDRSKTTRTNSDDVPWEIYFEQDEDGDTHLHAAIVRGFVEVALALIRAAPHPRLLDTPNDAALTPLHLAVATGQHPVARWLIIAGARPSPRNSEGNSPLHLAAKSGDLNCVRAIMDPVSPKSREALALGYQTVPYEKPKLDQWNYLGQTCAHVAASHGHLDVLRHLLANGADVNAREGLQGLTVLHYAVQNRDKQMVKFLLTESLRLNPDLPNYGGRNAWQICPVLPEDIRQYLTTTGMDSPYSSEEDSSDEDDDVEMFDSPPGHRFALNLVNAKCA